MQKKDRTKKAELLSKQRETELKLQDNKDKIRELQKEGTALMKEVAIIKDQVENFDGICDLEVTDHAVCRYLERFQGVDIDAARLELAAIAAKGKVMDGLNSWKAITGNHKIVVKDNAVITIMERK